MKKLFLFFAAMLVTLAVNAQTDFSTPYYCAADDAAITGDAPSNKVYLNSTVDPHQIEWSDVSKTYTSVIKWEVEATRGCYVSVSLGLGTAVSSNKHIFQIKIIDAKGNERGYVEEAVAYSMDGYTDKETVKALDGTILLPAAGTYTVELRNNRDYCKGSIRNVILTYAADAPSEIIEVSAVELNKTAVTLDLEEVELLTATVSPENATDPSVTWASSDPTVAKVNENGFVTAVAAGTANITATAGEQSAVCEVTVAAAAVPEVNFAEPCVLAGKVAHLEGAIWKNENYKLYGDGGSNKNYGTASWTINVTKPCIVSGELNGVEGGHIYGVDLYKGEELIGSLEQPEGKTWSVGEIALDGTLTFATAGNYTIKLRNTQEWSSGKVAGVTLTYVSDLPQTLYLKPGVWTADGAKFAVYYFKDDLSGWSDFMTATPEDENVYVGTIPAAFAEAKIIFVRLNGEATAPNWNDRWNQSGDLDIDANKPLYVITSAEGAGAWGNLVPDLENGFYLVGTFNSVEQWDYASLSAEKKLAANPEAEGEYMITVALKAGDKFKVISLENDVFMTWYGENDYVVTDGTAGASKTIYFSPVYKDAWGGHYYIQANDPTAISNTEAEVKAQKVIENGQIFILKNGVKYNVLGASVK